MPYVPRGIVPKFLVKRPHYVYITWERRFEVFITNQGLGDTISPDAAKIAVISCVDDAYLFDHFGEALVTEHRRAWGYICEATAGAPFENKERVGVVPSTSRASFACGRVGGCPIYRGVSRLETTMRAVGIEKSESEIVQIILRQLPERYDVVKTMTLSDPQLTRQRLENTIRSAYPQRKAHEIAKQGPAAGTPAEPPNPHALIVGRGFRHGGAMGGGIQQREDHMVSRGGGMPRQQQQLQQHWSRGGGMPRQQQQQQHWSRGGGMPRQQQQQQQ